MSACEPLLRTKFTASNVGSFEQSDAYGAIVTKVEASTRSNGVYGVTPHACRGVVRQLELAKNPMVRRPRGQRAIGTVIKMHPAVAAQQHRMLGTTQVHTAREHVGSSARKNRTLRRMLVEDCRGTDLAKPPQERGAQFGSHETDAAPTESMRSNTSRLMTVCGEPVSRSAKQP